MRAVVAILFLGFLILFSACKVQNVPGDATGNGLSTNAANSMQQEGLRADIDGTPWSADTYGIVPMGDFWIVKGTATDGSVFSIMLPEINGSQYHRVLQGGTVSVTYSTNRDKGFLFFAPFSNDNGWVKTETSSGYITGSFEVTISNGAIPKLSTGAFIIKFP